MANPTTTRHPHRTPAGPSAAQTPGRFQSRAEWLVWRGLGWGVGLGLVASLGLGPARADHPSAAAGTKPKVTAVAVDLPRYVGQWYQVALYPNKFQAQCVKDTTATYRPLPDGSIEVTNACRLQNGEMTRVVGQARYQDEAAPDTPQAARPAKLEVRFAPRWLSWLPLVWGDYWVIDVASDYRWAVVSEPQRQFLWVLSRSPALTEADDASIRRFLQAQGFDAARLQPHTHTHTPQANPNSGNAGAGTATVSTTSQASSGASLAASAPAR